MPDVRPIDANALKESARKVSVFRTYDAGPPDLRSLVDSAPTLDYAPVMHGEWIRQEDCNGDPYYTCSKCDEDWICIDGSPEENNMYFCPQCGAMMDGGKEDD